MACTPSCLSRLVSTYTPTHPRHPCEAYFNRQACASLSPTIHSTYQHSHDTKGSLVLGPPSTIPQENVTIVLNIVAPENCFVHVSSFGGQLTHTHARGAQEEHTTLEAYNAGRLCRGYCSTHGCQLRIYPQKKDMAKPRT
ncbi:hypothetical protein ACJQWK_00209 [Exserohilum turcicum]